MLDRVAVPANKVLVEVPVCCVGLSLCRIEDVEVLEDGVRVWPIDLHLLEERECDMVPAGEKVSTDVKVPAMAAGCTAYWMQRGRQK